MKDFRDSLTPETSPSREMVGKHFASGDLVRGAKMCARMGAHIEDFPTELRRGMRKLLFKKQPGYLLSFLYQYRVDIGFDIEFLLNKMLEFGDIETNFLVQVHRFQYADSFQPAIERAIQRLLDKGLVGPATAWKRKMSEIHGFDPININTR